MAILSVTSTEYPNIYFQIGMLLNYFYLLIKIGDYILKIKDFTKKLIISWFMRKPAKKTYILTYYGTSLYLIFKYSLLRETLIIFYYERL